MAKYRKKPVVIEASRWRKNGDHPDDYKQDRVGVVQDKVITFTAAECKTAEWEGEIVRYYRHPEVHGSTICEHCSVRMHEHGWIDTLEGGHTVCPGDWIITGVKGERYPCKPDIFAATYEPTELEPPKDG